MAIDRVRVNEQSSRTISFTLKDNTGTVVPLASISTVTLTLYDMGTYAPGVSPAVGILNSRDSQNVKNTNDVTIHPTSGLVTWAMVPDDSVIVTPRRQIERHRAEFHFTTTTGVQLDYQLEIEVLNLRKAA